MYDHWRGTTSPLRARRRQQEGAQASKKVRRSRRASSASTARRSSQSQAARRPSPHRSHPARCSTLTRTERSTQLAFDTCSLLQLWRESERSCLCIPTPITMTWPKRIRLSCGRKPLSTGWRDRYARRRRYLSAGARRYAGRSVPRGDRAPPCHGRGLMYRPRGQHGLRRTTLGFGS